MIAPPHLLPYRQNLLPVVSASQIPVTTFVVCGAPAGILQSDAQSIRVRRSDFIDKAVEYVDGSCCEAEVISDLITQLHVQVDYCANFGARIYGGADSATLIPM